MCIYYFVINYVRYMDNDYNNIRIGISNVREYPINVEIFLDDKRIMKDTIFPTGLDISIPYVFNVSLGFHSMKFKMDEDIYETEIFALLVKYLYIEYTGLSKKRMGPIIFYSKCTPPYYLGIPKQITIRDEEN